EPVAEHLQDLPRDLLPPRRELELLEESDRVRDRLGRALIDRAAADLDREGLGLQAPTAAGRAGLRGHVSLQLRAVLGVLGLAVAPLEHRDQALEGGAPVVLAALRDVGELDLPAAGAVEDDLPRRLGRLP